MSRSAWRCADPGCRATLGHVKPSGVLHLLPPLCPAFVDLVAATATFRCPACGGTRTWRGGGIDLERRGRPG